MPIISYLLIAFLGGVALRSFFAIPQELVYLAIGLPSGVFVVFKYKALNTFWLMVFLVLLLGVLRLDFYERKIEDDMLHLHYGGELILEGVVTKAVPKTNSEQLIVETKLGKLRVVKGIYPRMRYGDAVVLSGKISEPEPFGNYNTPRQLAKEQIYAEMIFPELEFSDERFFTLKLKFFTFLYLIKESFEEKLKLVLPEPHASLANGMLLGNEGALDSDIKDAFRKSGTIHILVLSGYNITIVGLFFLGIFSFVKNNFLHAALAGMGIVLFTLMTGAEPPAVRAMIMALIALIAFKTGRQNTAWLALLWSAFFMVLINPMLLAFDGSFQLSFLATLGLITASPWFLKKLSWLPDMMFVKESVVATLSAQVFVLPLIISWGNEISYLSPLANALVAGVVPYVMFFSFVGGLAGFVSLFLGKAVAAVAYLFISLQIWAAEFIGGFSPALFSVNYLPAFILIFSYAILFFWAYRVIKQSR